MAVPAKDWEEHSRRIEREFARYEWRCLRREHRIDESVKPTEHRYSVFAAADEYNSRH